MTSPSPRNLRITASNTLRRIPCFRPQPAWSFVAACAVGVGSLVVAAAGIADDSPLDRLQQRSGDARWEELRKRVGTAPGRARIGADLATDHADEPAPAAPDDIAPAAPEADLAEDDLGGAPADEAAPARPVAANPFEGPRDFRLEGPISAGRAGRATPLKPASETVLLQADEPPAFDSPEPLQAAPLRPSPITLRPITDIQPFFDYSPTGEDPCEHLCPPLAGICPDDPNRLCPEPLELPKSGTVERYFPHLEYYWAASDLYHNPLYFENPALERYGHVHINGCIEPVYSMARFSAQLVTLPYQMALDHACRHEYALGYYRPGDFTPKLIYQPPLNARAAGTAAAVYTGLLFLVP